MLPFADELRGRGAGTRVLKATPSDHRTPSQSDQIHAHDLWL